MAHQTTFFENTIPPCRHCGGDGKWEDAGMSSFFIGYKLERLACTRCTFQTDGIVLNARNQTLRAWIIGVPCCVMDIDKRRTMRLEEYYKFFHPPRWPAKPKIRYMGSAGYCLAIEQISNQKEKI